MTKVETPGCNHDHARDHESNSWLDFSPKVAAANVIFTVDTLLLSILIEGRETG
jgi:predicted nucleic acid-binding protein